MKLWISIAILAAAAGCRSEPMPRHEPPPPAPAPPPPAPPAPPPPPADPEVEPSRITVQHVLIAFAGATRAPANVTRTKDEAETFAKEILERVRKGEDIATLARDYSTDPGGGRYTLVNTGEVPGPGEIRRGQFIKPFVDVAFRLKVGEAGLAEYDKSTCPYGWHVIKRLE